MGRNDLRAARLSRRLTWLVASGFALALCTGLYFRAARERYAGRPRGLPRRWDERLRQQASPSRRPRPNG